MLSYNSLYAYQAEEGGLDTVTAHYKAERYAVMFERAASESEIRAVYKECFEDYIDGAQRILVKTSGDISERVGVSGILAAIGFVSSAAVQSEQVVANIRRLGTGVPFLAVILEIIGMTFIWNLSKEKTEEIQKALSERNEG